MRLRVRPQQNKLKSAVTKESRPKSVNCVHPRRTGALHWLQKGICHGEEATFGRRHLEAAARTILIADGSEIM